MHLQRFNTHTYKRDDHYPICSKLHCGCLLALCGPTMYVHVATLLDVLDNCFFLLSVHGSLKERKIN